MNFIIGSQFGFPFKINEIESRFGMSIDKILSYLDKNKNYKVLEYLSEKWIVMDSQLENFLDYIVNSIQNFHVDNPYRAGVLKKELNQKVKSDTLFFDFCIEILNDRKKIVRDKEIISLKDFKINLSSEEVIIQNKVVEILDNQGFSSQNYIQIADNLKLSADKLKLLISIAEQDQKIIRINEDLLFTSKNFTALINKIKKYFAENEKLSVSDFKDIAKTSRKYAVPLLEYLDKKNITYRQDNFRKLV
jgi:selenocysteine-specific elongation factor